MQREINFRAWSVCGKMMQGVSILEWTVGGLRAADAAVYICCCKERRGNLDLVDPNHIILEQYTGLKDKNGREIYEGDIVQIYDNENVVASVSYFYCSFQLMNGDKVGGMLGNFTDDDLEVIGNIHEHPELLK